MKNRVRLGTKIALCHVAWAVSTVTAFLIWLMVVTPKNPELAKLIWPEVWKIIGAIIGPSGLNLGVNEVRKLFENTQGGTNV